MRAAYLSCGGLLPQGTHVVGEQLHCSHDLGLGTPAHTAPSEPRHTWHQRWTCSNAAALTFLEVLDRVAFHTSGGVGL